MPLAAFKEEADFKKEKLELTILVPTKMRLGFKAWE